MKAWFKMAGYFLLVFFIGGTLYFTIGRPVQVLPLLDPIPVFELTDHRGETYSPLERGRLTLYTVGAARDLDNTEKTIDQLARVYDELEARGWSDEIDIAMISVDPEHDDPTVLQHLAERYELFQRPGTYLLTGPWVTVKLAVGSGMRIYFEDPVETDDELKFVYDQTLVLVDDQGVTRARYNARQLDLETLTRDIALLRKEANAEGAVRLAYQAAHLFMCYP